MGNTNRRNLMSETEIRITATDLDKNGKAESVIISFYKDNHLIL